MIKQLFIDVWSLLKRVTNKIFRSDGHQDSVVAECKTCEALRDALYYERERVRELTELLLGSKSPEGNTPKSIGGKRHWSQVRRALEHKTRKPDVRSNDE